jgi:hypothetical protein
MISANLGLSGYAGEAPAEAARVMGTASYGFLCPKTFLRQPQRKRQRCLLRKHNPRPGAGRSCICRIGLRKNYHKPFMGSPPRLVCTLMYMVRLARRQEPRAPYPRPTGRSTLVGASASQYLYQILSSRPIAMLLKEPRHAAILQANKRGFGLSVVAGCEEAPASCLVAAHAPTSSRRTRSACH